MRRGLFAPLRTFRDDRGSTSFSVMVAVILVVALMAISLQVYWIQSSSSSIQTVADAGAMAGASMISKVIIIVQVLDAILLSLNLVGLMLHLVVVITGVIAGAVTVGSGGLGSATLELFNLARDIDRAFMNMRKAIADAFIETVEALDMIAPYLAVANASFVVAENSGVASSGSQYFGLAVPVPFTGKLDSSGAIAKKDKGPTEKTGETEAGENRAKGAEYERAMQAVEAAKKVGYDLDTRATVPLASWTFETGKEDFMAWLNVAGSHVEIYGPYANSKDYLADADEIGDALKNQMKGWNRLTATNPYWREEYFYRMPKGPDYHEAGCRMLNNDNSSSKPVADNTEKITLTEAANLGLLPHDDTGNRGCHPVDWRAVQNWDAELALTLGPQWGLEVDAQAKYLAAQKAAEAAKTAREDELKKTAEEMFNEAKARLLGSRLTYEPPGRDGFICAVIQTNSRSLPAYTLPALTGSTDVKTGPQFAMSAAKILPAEGVDTISGIMDGLVAKARMSQGPLAFLGTLAKGFDLLFTIWDSCLSFYSKGISGLLGLTNDILGAFPGGDLVKGWATGIIEKALVALNIMPPELRQPQPVLVNTAFVLDDLPGGKVMTDSRNVYFNTGGLSSDGIKLLLTDYVKEQTANIGESIKSITVSTSIPIPIHGASISIPIEFTLPVPDVILSKAKDAASQVNAWAEQVVNMIPSGVGL